MRPSFLVLLAWSVCGSSVGCDGKARDRAPPSPPEERTILTGLSGRTIPELDFIDQNGAPVHLREDILDTHSVLVTFMFATCSSSCPLTAAVFTKMQGLLERRHLSNIQLVSVSVAAEDDLDTIHAWAKRFGAVAPTWRVLISSPSNVQTLAMSLTGANAAKRGHTPIILVGNRHTGRWHSAYGFDDPERLILAAETTQDEPENAP